MNASKRQHTLDSRKVAELVAQVAIDERDSLRAENKRLREALRYARNVLAARGGATSEERKLAIKVASTALAGK